MKKLLLLYTFYFQFICAQGSAGSDSKIEPRYLIDIPTAGMLSKGSIALDLDCYQSGGLLANLSYSMFDRLLVGISYGGTNIIGTDKPIWNNLPGISIKARIFNESIFIPALALGFDTQGKETYRKDLDRYSIKSLGFYLVVSKNYDLLGYLSFHSGINYSFERADGDKDPNLFLGIEKTVGSFISFVTDYNLGINDTQLDTLIKGNGYLNAGFRISVGGGFTIGFNLKDIVKNQQKVAIGSRTMKLEFVR